ncbi:MAG: class I SAM-dependent methyltransferase [Chthoniobacterales bacterium]
MKGIANERLLMDTPPLHVLESGMHQSSYDKMAAFRRDYLLARENEPLVILDLGGQDINGSYRPLFDQPPWKYIGVDLAPGNNVDVVLSDPYDWREFSPESADVIVAGQTFEHTEFFWETMRQIARTLRTNAICCIIVPSSGPEHRFPVDCWRMYPDGLRALARYAGLTTVEATTQWEDLPEYDNESNKWHDSVLIARKLAPD